MLARQAAAAVGVGSWERVGREKLLLRCRLLGRERRFGAHGERRGVGAYRGGACLQLLFPHKTWQLLYLGYQLLSNRRRIGSHSVETTKS